MRTLLLCVLLCGVACNETKKATTGEVGSEGTKDAAVEAAVEGPAGSVVDIDGTVTATRDGKVPRTLALGQKIFADDTVETKDDSVIAILLMHNGAIHDIGSGQVVRVRGSLAWKVERKSQGIFDSDTAYEGTSAAGVNAMKEAATHVSQLARNSSKDPSTITINEESTPTQNTRRPFNDRDTAPPKPHLKPFELEWKRDRQKRRVEGAPVFTGESAAAERERDLSWTAPSTLVEGDGGLGLVGTSREAGKVPGGQGAGKGTKKPGGPDSKEKKPDEAEADDSDSPPVPTKRAFVLGLAKACQEWSKGSGEFHVQITFANSKVSAMLIRGNPSLKGTLTCLKEKLAKSTEALEGGTITFSLKLAPLK